MIVEARSPSGIVAQECQKVLGRIGSVVRPSFHRLPLRQYVVLDALGGRVDGAVVACGASQHQGVAQAAVGGVGASASVPKHFQHPSERSYVGSSGGEFVVDVFRRDYRHLHTVVFGVDGGNLFGIRFPLRKTEYHHVGRLQAVKVLGRRFFDEYRRGERRRRIPRHVVTRCRAVGGPRRFSVGAYRSVDFSYFPWNGDIPDACLGRCSFQNRRLAVEAEVQLVAVHAQLTVVADEYVVEPCQPEYVGRSREFDFEFYILAFGGSLGRYGRQAVVERRVVAGLVQSVGCVLRHGLAVDGECDFRLVFLGFKGKVAVNPEFGVGASGEREVERLRAVVHEVLS